MACGNGAGSNDGRGTIVRPTSQQRRGNESMGNYYRRTGISMLGATGRTRGTAAAVRQGRGR